MGVLLLQKEYFFVGVEMLKLGIEVVEMSAVVEFHYGEVVAESRIGVAIDITTEVESQIGRFEGEGFHHLQGLVETFVGVGDTIDRKSVV